MLSSNIIRSELNMKYWASALFPIYLLIEEMIEIIKLFFWQKSCISASFDSWNMMKMTVYCIMWKINGEKIKCFAINFFESAKIY